MINKTIKDWELQNSYLKLPVCFYKRIEPTLVKSPKLICFNKNLAKNLNLNFLNDNHSKIVDFFSGNRLPLNSKPIAQAYAGHQFGHFTMLGDGRATLLGEHLTNKKQRYDIQFKGSGKTSFSRNGDGRAALGPMLREYIISEAINYLNIPTTRGLAVVKTGEQVFREIPLPGAILTRVASSHIRVGTFQYIAARENESELKIFFDYVINRHYPHLKDFENIALEFLKAVLDKQIDLVVNWMRVSFVHGVMNTDNMSISGETIDYGPCAFMDTYDPQTVFSSIDKMGRYAYCNQPIITKWNLARLAECLIPLIDTNQNKSIELATDIINSFEKKYEEKWMEMMRHKLGLSILDEKDKFLILDLLTWMHQHKADYTNTFCYLMSEKIQNDKIYTDDHFKIWKKRWQERLKKEKNIQDKSIKLMKKNNPIVIPRNHKIEEVLKAAQEDNLKPFLRLLEILKKPYSSREGLKDYQTLSNSDEKYKTFCGT